MWGRALRLCHKSNISGIRTYLSTAYKCDKEWSARSSARALRSVIPDELYGKLDQHSQSLAISPVDVDVFANCATPYHLGELRDLLHKLRCTTHAHQIMSSTHYATIRTFVNSGPEALPDLLHMLNDRLNYGLFLDRFTANMLFDRCLKDNDFESAATIAGLLMLQEDFESPIAEEFALYSTYKYLSIPIEPKPKEEAVAKETSGKKKKIEEIKIRVAFLRNPFFDEHFDLTDLRMIAGKTLAVLTSEKNDATSLDCNLLGLVSFKKYDKANNVVQKLVEKGSVYKETVDAIKNIIETYDGENKDNLQKLENISSALNAITIVDESMEKDIKKKLLDTINKFETEEIEEQIQVYLFI